MKIIREVNGTPLALTQSDGETFRIFARETKELDDSLISDEILAECKAGGILITDKEVVSKKQTSKTGGVE